MALNALARPSAPSARPSPPSAALAAPDVVSGATRHAPLAPHQASRFFASPYAHVLPLVAHSYGGPCPGTRRTRPPRQVRVVHLRARASLGDVQRSFGRGTCLIDLTQACNRLPLAMTPRISWGGSTVVLAHLASPPLADTPARPEGTGDPGSVRWRPLRCRRSSTELGPIGARARLSPPAVPDDRTRLRVAPCEVGNDV